MLFWTTYFAAGLLELLAFYTIASYVRNSDSIERVDPLTLRPWWRNNIVARRDWLVGIPFAICGLLSFSPIHRGGSAHHVDWQYVGFLLLMLLVNAALFLSLAFYRPASLILFTICVLQSAACLSDSDPGPYGWSHPLWKLLWLAFPILCITLWFRALQSIRRRSRIHRVSMPPALQWEEG